MGQQCCNIPEPDDPCEPCFLTQTWTSQLPPEELITNKVFWTLATSGAADRNATDDCDLPAEETHSHLKIIGDGVRIIDGTNNWLDDYPHWVHLSDDAPSNIYQYWFGSPWHRLIQDGKLYRYWRLNNEGNRDLNRVEGYFYIPWQSLLNNTYTKAFEFGIGSDWAGRPITDNILPEGQLKGGDGRPFDWELGYIHTGVGQCLIQARPDDGAGGYHDRLSDWRIYMFYNNPINGGIGEVNSWDTGLSLGQYHAGGMSLRVEERQTEFVEEGIFGYKVNVDYRVICQNTGVENTINVQMNKYRCQHSKVACVVKNRGVTRLSSDEALAEIKRRGEFQSLVSPVNTWWMDQHCDTEISWASIGYINRVAVLDIDGNDDGAGFICRSFRGTRFNGIKPFIEVTPDEGEFTLNSGDVIQFDARVGDTYVVGFDNLGNETTEVTNVTFDGTIVTGVDRRTESFAPYEYNTFTFDGALLPGGASNVCSPASSASINPAKLTLTGDSPDIIDSSETFSMTYNGTTNKFAMAGSNNIIFKSFNGNTAYTCNVQLQVIRGGTPKVNLSHDVSDSMVSDTNSGSTVSDATMTLDSAVSQLNLTNPSGDTTASIMDPDPYVPNFGDVVRLKLKLTGNSDSTVYVRIWESTIDCTTGVGPGGLQESDITFTHDQGGDLIDSPFVLTLRSSNDIK